MAATNEQNASGPLDENSALHRFQELEGYPWLFEGEPAALPPPEVAKFVVLVPINANGEKDFFPALAAADAAAFLSHRSIAVALVGMSPIVDLGHVFELVASADAVVVLMVSDELDPTDSRYQPWLSELLGTVVRFARSNGVVRLYGATLGPLDIPVDDFDQVVKEPLPESTEQVRRAAAQLANYHIAQTAGAVARQVATKKRQERIERNAAEYIEDATTALRDRERRWKQIAHMCNGVGFSTLLGGAVAVVYFSEQTLKIVETEVQWPLVVYLAVKSVIVVALLVATSKYAFTIGRSYMNEALKNADRIHAINFGTFYLKAYGDAATWEQLKEVFQHWNIARDSGFAALDSSQFDPQLIAAAVEIAKSLSPSHRANDAKK